MKTRKVKEGLIIVSVLVALVLVYPLTNFIKPTKEEQKVDGPNFESPIINNAGYSVSSTSDYANEIAINVLNNGGNAVDAVIAMSFALGVTSPQNGVLGSGGLFLVYSSQEDQAFVYDFYGSSGYEKSNYNIGIPGYLKGIDLIHSDYGTKPIEELIQPSIDLARNGIIVNRDLGEIFERRPWIAEMNSSFYKDGVIVKEGEILIQEELANTYEFVKNEGLLSFYETDNPITQNFMDISGYSLESLKDYKAIKHDALVLEYDNKKMFVPNAPFSGLTSAQILIMLGENDINFSNLDDDSYNTIKKIYLNAFDYNRKIVADDDSIREHINVDFKNHTFGLDLNNAINDNVFDIDESENTTSYTVIDRDGLTVVGVHTLSNYWGSTYARDGFFYNNVLKNFSKKGINAFDYHKRPKTYISPVILSSDSEIIAIGTPGAYAIPQVTANLIHQISRNDISLSQAMDMRQMALYDDYLVFDTQGVRKNDFNELPYTLEYSTYPNNVTLSRFSISRKVGDKFESYYDKYWCESNCALDFNE